MHRPIRCALVVAVSTLIATQSISVGLAQDNTTSTTQSSNTATVSSATHRSARRHTRRITHRRHSARRYSTANLNSDPAQATPGDRLATIIRLDDGAHVWTPSRRMLGVSYAGDSTNDSPGGTFSFTVDREKLKRYLTRLKPLADHAPSPAHPVVTNPSADDDGTHEVEAHIVPARNGGALDVMAAVDRIQHAIQSDATTVHIALPMVPKYAKGGSVDLGGIDARIGYFVTRFNPGEVGRTQTVRRAIDLIDGTVVKPGETFSVNKTVGERTAERGFGMGHVFVDGKMQVQLGGGMCQVATTLFNAAMLAALKIVERHQHVRTIPYASPGRDATVYWGSKDFKFQNDTDTPIYISYKTTRNHAIVALYGKGVPGRKVILVSHHRRLGERHFTGSFWRIVKYPDGRVEKSTPYYSDYQWTPALDYSR